MSGPRYTVTLRLDAEDFEQLSQSSTKLNPINPDSPHRFFFPDRFRDPATGTFPPDLDKYQYAYWYSEYANLILARSYLDAIGADYQIASDEYEPDEEAPPGGHIHHAGWVIFTDYASPAWTRPLRGSNGTEQP